MGFSFRSVYDAVDLTKRALRSGLGIRDRDGHLHGLIVLARFAQEGLEALGRPAPHPEPSSTRSGEL